MKATAHVVTHAAIRVVRVNRPRFPLPGTVTVENEDGVQVTLAAGDVFVMTATADLEAPNRPGGPEWAS